MGSWEECPRKDSKTSWKLERSLVLLSGRVSDKDHRICGADGTFELNGTAFDGKGQGLEVKVWRAFRDSVCKKNKVTTREDSGARTHWNVASSNSLYVPPDGSGTRICLCKVEPPDLPPYFTWVEHDCSAYEHHKDELCFHTLTDMDILRYSYLMDEVT